MTCNVPGRKLKTTDGVVSGRSETVRTAIENKSLWSRLGAL